MGVTFLPGARRTFDGSDASQPRTSCGKSRTSPRRTPSQKEEEDLEALLGLIKDCLAYEHENRIGAKDFRKRTLDILSEALWSNRHLDVFS